MREASTQFDYRLASGVHARVLAYYAVLSALMTYPLLLQMTTHFPGMGGDGYVFLWNFWYFKEQLLNGQNPLFTDLMFYPVGASLVFQSYTLVNTALAAVALLFTGNLALVLNLFQLLSFILSGYFSFLLIHQLTHDRRASLLGGTIFAFCPYKFAQMLGHFELTSTHWIPLFLLFFLKMTSAQGGYRHAAIAGLIAVLTLLDVHYYAVFLLLFVLLFYLYGLLHLEQRKLIFSAPQIRKALVLAGVALLLSAPYLGLAYRDAKAGFYDPAEGWLGANHFAGDITAYFVPSFLHPLWKSWVANYYFRTLNQSTEGNFVESVIFIGWLVTALVFIGGFYLVRRRPELRVWRFLAFSFIILSMGPTLHILGKYIHHFDELALSIPLPYILLHYLPVIANVRCPNRLIIMFMLCAGVLSAYVWLWIQEKLAPKRRRVFLAVAMAIILMEYLSVPYPMHPAYIPSVFEKLAAEQSPDTVLEIPAAFASSIIGRGINAHNPFWQYVQTVHKKKRIGGYTGSGVRKVLEYYEGFPVIQHLLDVEEKKIIPAEQLEKDKASVAELILHTSLKYIIVHPDFKDSPPHLYVLNVFSLGDPIYDEEGFLVYQVTETPLAER